jgi:hypothetical protein
MNPTIRASLALASLALASSVHAQFTIDWYTIDNGGGRTTAGAFEVTGSIGLPDASDVFLGGLFELRGGFWPSAAACYANCDNSSSTPILTANDFQCFLNKFAAGDPAANCDNSTNAPVLNVNDFQCFLNTFAAGCN